MGSLGASLRISFAGSALLLATTALPSATSAQQFEKAPVYQYCLLDHSGGGLGGGPMTLCRYTSMGQCLASKGSSIDTCIVNPELTFRPRR